MSAEVLRAALAALEPPLERHRVRDDDNSLFRAIAHQLTPGCARPRRPGTLLCLSTSAALTARTECPLLFLQGFGLRRARYA
jgi:hypothetical protein